MNEQISPESADTGSAGTGSADTSADTGAPASPDTPEPASSWVEEHAPPATEAERQAQETVRSVSRLEESN